MHEYKHNQNNVGDTSAHRHTQPEDDEKFKQMHLFANSDCSDDHDACNRSVMIKF